MNKKLSWQPLLVAALAAIASVPTSCGNQPPVKCTASANPGAARFKLTTMTGDCSMTPLVQAKGEVVGVQTYVPPMADNPDYYHQPNSVALQSEGVSLLVANGAQVMPPVV